MRSSSEHEQLTDPATYRDLQLISEVESNPEITQRELSRKAGIALGLTNVLLRNLAQKGYLRISRAGWKRWLYTLTPEGFSHKVRLTVTYIYRVLDHYQKVRQTLRAELEPLALTAESRVALYGTSEFAELVYLGLRELGIEEIEIFGAGSESGGRFLGMPVQDVAKLQPESYDRIVVAFMGDSEAALGELQGLDESSPKLVTFFKYDTVGRAA